MNYRWLMIKNNNIMNSTEKILSQITVKEIATEYSNGGFISETNSIFNNGNVDVEVIDYSDYFEVNFWNEDEELLFTQNVTL